MADISNAELKKEIQGILKDADLDNTSAKKVILQRGYRWSFKGHSDHRIKLMVEKQLSTNHLNLPFLVSKTTFLQQVYFRCGCNCRRSLMWTWQIARRRFV